MFLSVNKFKFENNFSVNKFENNFNLILLFQHFVNKNNFEIFDRLPFYNIEDVQTRRDYLVCN